MVIFIHASVPFITFTECLYPKNSFNEILNNKKSKLKRNEGVVYRLILVWWGVF